MSNQKEQLLPGECSDQLGCCALGEVEDFLGSPSSMAKCQNNSGNCKLIMAMMWRIMANGPKIMATDRWYGKTRQ
jgi:hypothetical protein